MTGGWGGGYVTDIGYEAGYYHEQSPGNLRLACLLGGVIWDVPQEGAHYVELGSGVGLNALITAAANPSWQVTGLDFNPGHIATARSLARATGIDNVTFIEADLSDFSDSAEGAALAQADIVTAHGVWSWVAPTVRAGIVRLLARKLRPGGVFHVSYNAMPGWQGMLAVQRLVREVGHRAGSRSDRQAQAGIELVRELAATEAVQLRGDARLVAWLERLGTLSPAYLAHELMNSHWQPCWHADVAAALAEAKLVHAGSAALVENFPELTMTAEQRAIADRFDDPLVREMIKDTCAARTLRHDVYVRGARRLSQAGRDAALRELTLALTVPEERVQLAVPVAAGMAELAPAFYRPVVRMLAQGPARIGDLLKAPGAVAHRENPAELAGLLAGTRQAVVVARPEARVTPRIRRFNAALADQVALPENLRRNVAVASEVTGGGVNCTVSELFVLGRALAGDETGDGRLWAAALGAGLPEEGQALVAEALQRARGIIPTMRAVGCLD